MAQRRKRLNMYDPAVYSIRIHGDLPTRWCEYFGTQSLTVSVDKSGSPANTLISEAVDQAALIGMVNHLNALGLPLISVECLSNEVVDEKGNILA